MSLPPFSRRSLLLGAAGAGVAGYLLVPANVAAAAEGNTTVLRNRWKTIMVGGTPPAVAAITAQVNALTTRANELTDSMQTGSGRTALWSDLPIGSNPGNITASFNRLREMGLALATPGQSLYGNSALGDTIDDGLTFLATKYKSGVSKYGNWWHWEIGSPRAIVDTLTLTFDSVTPSVRTTLLGGVSSCTPDPNRRGTSSLSETGANRADKAFTAALHGILANDSAKIAQGRDALSDTAKSGANSVLKYTSSGDGFYTDGGFVQHGYLPYTGTYGGVALKGVAELVTLLATSNWPVTDPGLTVILDSVTKTFAPVIRSGRVLETVRGRAVSREDERDFVSAFPILDAVLLLALSSSAPYASTFTSLAKRWITTNTLESPIGHASGSVALSVRAHNVKSGSAAVATDPNSVRFIPSFERFIARRSTWVFAVNTSSSRIGRYEWGNNENNLGWYQGDGMTFLHLDATPDHYSNDFWPTVNPYRLPGTVVSAVDRPTGASGTGTGIPRASQAFAGGVAVGSDWGTVAMDHRNFDSTVTGFLSWYIFNDAIIGLGSNISESAGEGYHGTVENRAFAPGQVPTVTIDGASKTLGTSATAVGSYVHVPDVAGYLKVPTGKNTLNWSAIKSPRTGTWQAINSGYSTTTRSRDYLNVHLSAPSSGGATSFAYAILPRASLAATQAWQSSPPVEVLAQTSTAHVVGKSDDTVVLANFLAATSGAVGGISTTAPISAAVRKNGTQTDIAVAQPSRTANSGTVVLNNVTATATVRKDAGVTVTSYSPLTIQFDFTGRKGAALTLSVK